MTGWKEIADDALQAAGLCLRNRRYRSAVSRSYYAVYSTVTAALLKAGLTPPQGRQAWSHARLPRVVRENLLDRIGRGKIKDVCRMLRRTYRLRIMADYVSSQSIDKDATHRCLSDAIALQKQLEPYT